MSKEKRSGRNSVAVNGMENQLRTAQNTHLFQDRLPEEIVKELTPEVRRQYFLWDEIMKREIELYPYLILPVIREVFGREYPADGNISLLSTEYTVSRIHEQGEKLLHAIRSDLLLKIESDLYHFECQIEKDGKMVFRMLEYDVHIALTHGKTAQKERGGKEEFEVFFPRSAVLYLGDAKNVPEYEACTIHFSDGGSYLYKVPVMKVQEYEVREIEERHLDILIPFLPIRFRKRIKKESGKEREELKRNLAEFLSECSVVLGKEKERGIITENASKDIAEFLWKACGYLLEEDVELYKEVSSEVEPAIKLDREIIQELRDDIMELQDNNKELQDNNKELQDKIDRGRESVVRLVNELKKDGKSREEVEDVLAKVFLLTEEEAKEKVKAYW